MIPYRMLFITCIILQSSVCIAADSPVQNTPRALRKRVISGAWTIGEGNQIKNTTGFAKIKPIPIPSMPRIKKVLPNRSPDCSKIVTPGDIVSKKRNANYIIPTPPKPKRARRTKNAVPISPAVPEANTLALNVNESANTLPSISFTPESDTSPLSNTSESLPSSPLKPDRELAIFYEERDFSAQETAILCQAIHQLLQEKERETIKQCIVHMLQEKAMQKRSKQAERMRVLQELTQETTKFFESGVAPI